MLDESIHVSIVNKNILEDKDTSKTLNFDISLNPNEKTIFNSDLTEISIIKKSVIGNNEIESNQSQTIIALLQAAGSFRASLESRLKIVEYRLRIFYSLIHSRLPIENLLPYLATNSIFLRDIIALCDMNSETYSDLKQLTNNSFILSSICSECLVALVTLITRRRGPLLQQLGVLQDLGLKTHVRRNDNENSNQENNWVSIISSACNSCLQSIQSQQINSKDCTSVNETVIEMIVEPNLIQMDSYVSASLELFLLCLSVGDQTSLTSVSQIISSIVSLIRSCIPNLQSIFSSKRIDFQLSFFEIHIITTITKCIGCLVSCLERGSTRGHPSYIEILQEYDFLTILSTLIDIFSLCPCLPNEWPNSFHLYIKNQLAFN